jgi:hypothetical protein
VTTTMHILKLYGVECIAVKEVNAVDEYCGGGSAV